MKGVFVQSRREAQAIASALGVRSPEAERRVQLRQWADGVVAAMSTQGRLMDTVDAIFTALYLEQRRLKVPNSYLAEVLRDLAKEIVADRLKAGAA